MAHGSALCRSRWNLRLCRLLQQHRSLLPILPAQQRVVHLQRRSGRLRPSFPVLPLLDLQHHPLPLRRQLPLVREKQPRAFKRRL